MAESDIEGESRMKRARRGEKEENEDRLSDLPDCILLHILTFMNIKHVVQTCVLSKRWKDLWKRVPTLVLHSSQFKRLALFTKFVTKVMSCRDDSAALCNLDFMRYGCVEPYVLKRLVTFVVSHKVQQLRISVMCNIELPPAIFSCQTLTSLELSIKRKSGSVLFPKSLGLAALTNLHVENFEFCPSDDGRLEPFSNCKKLHSLFIAYCDLGNAQILCVSNVRVANLVICNSNTVDKIVLSTPNLRSFSFTNYRPQKLVGSNLFFLEEVYIDASWSGCVESALVLNGSLQVFTNVKSMTLSSSTLQVLSLIPNLRNMQSFCFGNLNSLKVQLKRPFAQVWVPVKSKKVKLKPSSNPSPLRGVVDYLLQNSSLAEITIYC